MKNFPLPFLNFHAHGSSLKAVPALFTNWLTKNGVPVAGWLLLFIATTSFPGRCFCYRSLNLPWKKLAKNLHEFNSVYLELQVNKPTAN